MSKRKKLLNWHLFPPSFLNPKPKMPSVLPGNEKALISTAWPLTCVPPMATSSVPTMLPNAPYLGSFQVSPVKLFQPFDFEILNLSGSTTLHQSRSGMVQEIKFDNTHKFPSVVSIVRFTNCPPIMTGHEYQKSNGSSGVTMTLPSFLFAYALGINTVVINESGINERGTTDKARTICLRLSIDGPGFQWGQK